MRTEVSKTHSYLSGAQVRPLHLKKEDINASLIADLPKLGIGLDMDDVRAMMAGTGMDTVTQPLLTTASIGSPIQFLQTWLAGYVSTITAARKIDEILGIRIVGDWEDEEIIQPFMEPTGVTQPYGDFTNMPLANYNRNYERRTIQRFEAGMVVGVLEAKRAAKVRVSDDAMKRAAATLTLEIQRNLIGFNGFNGGAGRTYGFLNDPNLPAYVTVAATGTGSSTLWANKTYLQINADIRAAIAQLQTQSQDNLNPENVAMTLVLPTNCYQFLSITPDFGNSVRKWMGETYPKLRIVSAPQLNNANGGANVFYLFADTVNDGVSEDGGNTFDQLVQTKFVLLGTEKRVKTYAEDFSNATAGVILKRPFAVVRYTGI